MYIILRLCRPRRIVECSFGILVQRFRIFRRPIPTSVSTAKKITKAAVCLHNFILQRLPRNLNEQNCENLVTEQNISNCFVPTPDMNHKTEQEKCLKLRDDLAEYFMHYGLAVGKN